MAKKTKIMWLERPKDHNYPAAMDYLCLLYEKKMASKYVNKLKRAPIVEFLAKDIFRASGLPLLGVSNVRLQRDRKKILANEELSPLLLVRDTKNGKVVIADGYHRMCAVYSYDEDASIPCKIV